MKTEDQAQRFGGAAGSWYDPCYHLACDTLQTVLTAPPEGRGSPASKPGDAAAMRGGGVRSIDSLADAAAHAAWYLGTRADPLG